MKMNLQWASKHMEFDLHFKYKKHHRSNARWCLHIPENNIKWGKRNMKNQWLCPLKSEVCSAGLGLLAHQRMISGN